MRVKAKPLQPLTGQWTWMVVGAGGGGKVTMLWRANARVLSLAGVAVALLLMGACSAPPPVAAPPSASSATTSTATVSTDAAPGQSLSGSSVGPSGDEPARGSGANDGGSLAWVPPGPVDPADPPQAQWYLLLQNKDCAGLGAAVNPGTATSSDGFALWSAVTAICRAVYHGDASGWADAAANLSTLGQPGPERCLDRTAYNLVAAFLAFHALNPAANPSPGVASGTACPLALTGLDALDDLGPTRATLTHQ